MTKVVGSRMRAAVAQRKRRLLLSVSLLAGGVAGYGRGAYAQQICPPSGGSSYLCTGNSNDTQTINADNADVRTNGSLIVETYLGNYGTGGDGIAVNGRGALRFTSPADAYTVVSGDRAGLAIRSTGDVGGIAGSVTVDTNGYFAGAYGIDAVNYGSGATTVIFDGSAVGRGVGSTGISARGPGSGGLFITTGVNSFVSGDSRGIIALNTGTGPTNIRVDGDVEAASGIAVSALNSPLGSDLTITTGANSQLEGETGVFVRNLGKGTALVDIGGDVTVTGQYGILVEGRGNSGDLVVTTRAGSTIKSAAGIFLNNRGHGNASVTIGGDIIRNRVTGNGVAITNLANAGSADVTTTAKSFIYSGSRGIAVSNGGTGATSVRVDGDVVGVLQDGIYVNNTGGATGIAVTTSSASRVKGGKYGINATNSAGGATTVVVDGQMSGTRFYGIQARNHAAATDLAVTTGAGSIVVGDLGGIVATNDGTGATTVTVNGDVRSQRIRGVFAGNGTRATDLTVTTGSGSNIKGGLGLHALNLGTGNTTVTVGGNIVGLANDGVHLSADNARGSKLTILKGATVTSSGSDADDDGIELRGQASVTLAGTVKSGGGYAIRFDAAKAYDDRLELQPGWSVSGKVDAGLGFDRLVLGGAAGAPGGIDATFDMGRVDIGGTGSAGAAYAGFEAFSKTGSSTFKLVGGNSGAAGFDIERGALVMDATLPNLTFSVGSGATLLGNGTAGSIAALRGATIAPGRLGEIGTLHASNFVTFDAGSRLAVDITADGRGDRIVADTATLKGGTVLVDGIPSQGSYVDGRRYVIVDAAGGRDGTFEGVRTSVSSIFLDFALIYTPTEVAIEADVTSFDSVAASANQAAAARALTALGNSSDPDAQLVYNRLLFTGSAAEARRAFDAASGEIHASLQTGLASSNLAFTDALRGRIGLMSAGDEPAVGSSAYALDQRMGLATSATHAIDRAFTPAASPASYGVWGGLIGESVSISGDTEAAGLDQKTGGFFGGVELFRNDTAAFGALTVGMAFGYSHSDADSGPFSSAGIDSGHVGAYTALESGPLLLTAAAGYGFHEVETSRRIVFSDIDRTAKADYDADSIGFSGEARYRFELGRLTLAPFASLEAAHVSTSGGRETGAGALDLSMEKASYGAGTAGIGVALGREWMVDGTARVRTEVRAAYEHGFGGRPEQSLVFSPGTIGFDVAGLDGNDNGLALGAGVDVDFARGFTLSGRYDGSFGSDSQSHSGQIAIGYKF